MKRIIFTAEDVERAYDELERRIYIEIQDDNLRQENVIEYREIMLQGLYGTLMALAKNWPDVRFMCDMEEEKRNFSE